MKAIKFMAMLAVAAAAGAVQAEDSYLYWMVDSAHMTYDDSDVEFKYATVRADGDSNYMYLYAAGDTTSNVQGMRSSSSDPTSTAGAMYALFDSSSSFTSFMVELWNENREVVGWQRYSRDSLTPNILAGTGFGAASPLLVSGVVPEPTSGLLLLLGLAGLGLRRRREVLAA